MSDPFINKEKIGVVLLNWHNWLETKTCLANLARLGNSTEEIITIVVDNGSSDDSVQQLENLTISHLIRLKTNLGFAAGCNHGIRKALEMGCNLILLLNSDVEFAPNFIDPLMGSLHKHPEIGIASPKIVNDETPAKIYYAGGKIFPFRMQDRLIGIGKLDSSKFDQAGFADFGIGCCLLIKREVFEKVGYLDELFFFDYEDVDFCYRAQQMGFCTWYEPGSIIIHKAPLLPRNKHRAFLLGKARITFFFKYIKGHKFWPAFFLECIHTIRVMFNHLIRKRGDLALGYAKGVTSGLRFQVLRNRVEP